MFKFVFRNFESKFNQQQKSSEQKDKTRIVWLY